MNRNFAGFGREIFTDTGVYALRMDAASVAAEPRHIISKTALGRPYRSSAMQTSGDTNAAGFGEAAAGRGMTLDERAVMLAAAMSVDFDYFSRHSGHGGGIIPFGAFGEHNSSGSLAESPTGGAIEVVRGAIGGTMGGTMRSPLIEAERLQQPPPWDG